MVALSSLLGFFFLNYKTGQMKTTEKTVREFMCSRKELCSILQLRDEKLTFKRGKIDFFPLLKSYENFNHQMTLFISLQIREKKIRREKPTQIHLVQKEWKANIDLSPKDKQMNISLQHRHSTPSLTLATCTAPERFKLTKKKPPEKLQTCTPQVASNT